MTQPALGLIETMGMTAALEGADTALKTAAVNLLGCQKVTGGLVTVVLSGDVAAVQAAVSAGSAAASRMGLLVGQHVIPRPLADLPILLGGPQPSGASEPEVPMPDSPETVRYLLAALDRDYLESLPVVELRRLARQMESLPIKGREISRANKETLITEILQAKENELTPRGFSPEK